MDSFTDLSSLYSSNNRKIHSFVLSIKSRQSEFQLRPNDYNSQLISI